MDGRTRGAQSPPPAPTVVLLPTWQIIGSQFWKAQVGYLSLHHRVVTFDGRGSGRSDKPVGAAAYANTECAADILAVLDATSTERAVLVALSCAATWAVHAAAEHPERVAGIVAISPACGFPISNPERDQHVFDAPNPITRAGPATTNTTGCTATFRRFNASSSSGCVPNRTPTS